MDVHRLTGGRTLLVLAAAPGDESAGFGLLIGAACAVGRPPLVAVLTDGAALGASGPSAAAHAARHARETRAAVRALKLPPERLLLLGLDAGAVPVAGPFFERIVDAIAFLTWRHDLNVVCGPPSGAAGAIAAAVARAAEIGRLACGEAAGAVALDAACHAASKARAVAAHVSRPRMEAPASECYVRSVSLRAPVSLRALVSLPPV